MELRTGPALAALMTLPGIGPARAEALAARFEDWAALLGAGRDLLVEALGVSAGTALAEHLPTRPPAALLPRGMQVVSRHDPHYPDRLHTLTDAPVLLWWTGTLPPATPSVAIVGTRTPNPFGVGVASLAGRVMAEHGVPTVSGLARGVDALAHAACMDTGVPTWAVLGQGVDTVPKRGDRAALAGRILATGGGLLAEVPPGTGVASHLLTRRNRLQSGLAAGVVIAQTGLPSGQKPAGTIHTARFAIEQDRLLAVAAPPNSGPAAEELAGNAALVDPTGIDPRLLHATQPALAARIAERRPAADRVIRGPEDLAAFARELADAVPAAAG